MDPSERHSEAVLEGGESASRGTWATEEPPAASTLALEKDRIHEVLHASEGSQTEVPVHVRAAAVAGPEEQTAPATVASVGSSPEQPTASELWLDAPVPIPTPTPLTTDVSQTPTPDLRPVSALPGLADFMPGAEAVRRRILGEIKATPAAVVPRKPPTLAKPPIERSFWERQVERFLAGADIVAKDSPLTKETRWIIGFAMGGGLLLDGLLGETAAECAERQALRQARIEAAVEKLKCARTPAELDQRTAEQLDLITDGGTDDERYEVLSAITAKVQASEAENRATGAKQRAAREARARRPDVDKAATTKEAPPVKAVTVTAATEERAGEAKDGARNSPVTTGAPSWPGAYGVVPVTQPMVPPTLGIHPVTGLPEMKWPVEQGAVVGPAAPSRPRLLPRPTPRPASDRPWTPAPSSSSAPPSALQSAIRPGPRTPRGPAQTPGVKRSVSPEGLARALRRALPKGKV